MKSGIGWKWYRCKLVKPNISDQEVDVLAACAKSAAMEYAKHVSLEADVDIRNGAVAVLGVIDGDSRKSSWPKFFTVTTEAVWTSDAVECRGEIYEASD
jgi:hypothetical protein